jgi:hypothetical protein
MGQKFAQAALVLSVGLLLAAAPVAAQEMPHETLRLECETCHTTESFTEVSFDHDAMTAFPLRDRHQLVDCRGCHTLKDFSKVKGTDCQSCHTDIHEAKLGPDCGRCHVADGWKVLDIFEVHEQTNFPIMGKHAMLDCQSCHNNFPRGDLSHTDSRCVACHQSDYLAVSNPNHVTAGFSTDCESCHQMNTFRPALLPDHDIFFPIYSGEHKGVWDECATCHTNPSSSADFTCLPCHDHRQSEMDQVHNGIPGYSYTSADCYLCHPTGKAEEFGDHDALFFPIFSGSHQGEWDNCSTCHTTPLDRKVFDCLSCHEHRQSEMDGKHGSMSGYSYTSIACLECHPSGDKGTFTAHDAEFFPIYSGAHQSEWTDCATCHTVASDRSVFDCISCHEHEQTATDAAHGSMSGYSYTSTACYDCHPTGEGGLFTDHDAQFFPIFSGSHNNQWDACSSCHPSSLDRSVFDCLSCHEHRQSEMDGQHGSMSGYSYTSTACLDCHPSGDKGTFTAHDAEFFPIYSGAHQSEWTDCATCHTVASDRSVFDCVSCHEHEQTATDAVHGSMSGYSYTSTACYDCHPTGEGGLFTDHDAQFFPIFSGSHNNQWDACSSCHPSSLDRSVFDCLSCHEHSQAAMDGQHGSMSGYSYTSTACLDCHPSGDKGTFTAHDAEFFPIFSGEHSGEWGNDCSTCHEVPLDRSQFTCLSCHEHNQTSMDDEHQGEVNNYVYESTACYDCHPNGQGD